MKGKQIVTEADSGEPLEIPLGIDLGGAAHEFEGLSRLAPDEARGLDEEEAPDPVAAIDFQHMLGAAPSADLALLRLRPDPGPDGEGPGEAALEAAAERLWRAHRPPLPIAFDEGDLVLALPLDVAWSSVAATASHALGVDPIVGLVELRTVISPGQALRASAAAVEEAEQAGRAVATRTAADEAAAHRERQVVESLLESLRSGEGLRLVAQPAYDVATRALVGAELLLRHESESHGSIGPAEFLPIAARAGILDQVERWVLDAALERIGAWQGAGVLGVPISINVSAADFLAEDFADRLAAGIERSAVDPAQVVLEVPEEGVVASADAARARVEQMHALGVAVALDDVGASDTGLTGLRQLPVDALKVHRSFVLGMERDTSMAALVRGVISLAGALGMRTCAAGVETGAQLITLGEFGCDAVQGYLLSRPLELSAFEELMGQA